MDLSKVCGKYPPLSRSSSPRASCGDSRRSRRPLWLRLALAVHHPATACLPANTLPAGGHLPKLPRQLPGRTTPTSTWGGHVRVGRSSPPPAAKAAPHRASFGRRAQPACAARRLEVRRHGPHQGPPGLGLVWEVKPLVMAAMAAMAMGRPRRWTWTERTKLSSRECLGAQSRRFLHVVVAASRAKVRACASWVG